MGIFDANDGNKLVRNMSELNTRFSIVIPTLDRNEALATCLTRLCTEVQRVSSTDFEIIVTDDSPEGLARKMIESDFPLVRWVEGPGRGPSANRNNGARNALGQWIFFTDDDCIPDSHWLNFLIEHSKCGFRVLEGKTICSAGLSGRLYEAPINEVGGFLWSCNFAIQRELFFELGGFDERFPFASGEDEEFRERLKKFGIKTLFVPKAIVDHPPRLRPFGAGWNKRWQSQVLKERIMGITICADQWMPLRIAKSRIAELTHAKNFRELGWLACSAAIEVVNISRFYRTWEKWANEVAQRERPKIVH
jgi:glycosyltransferase involved in cell wall biosynthesis